MMFDFAVLLCEGRMCIGPYRYLVRHVPEAYSILPATDVTPQAVEMPPETPLRLTEERGPWCDECKQ